MNAHHPGNEPQAGEVDREQWLNVVQQLVGSISFGEVVITVHDSKVVQIDKTEKLRLPQKK